MKPTFYVPLKPTAEQIRGECRPLASWTEAPYSRCRHSPICQRCRRCLLHCVCPPPDLRATATLKERV